MEFKQGNTYELPAVIDNVDINDITKVVFQFDNIKKTYLSDGTGDVEYSDGKFIISLTQQETLQLDGKVAYEVAIKFNDGKVRRSKVKHTTSLLTIIKEAI